MEQDIEVEFIITGGAFLDVVSIAEEPPNRNVIHRLTSLPVPHLVQFVMFRFPLQRIRSDLKRASSTPVRTLTGSSAPDCYMRAGQAVTKRQATHTTANKGEIIDKLCARLTDERQTTRAEQLVWLAKDSLEASVAQKRGVAKNDTMKMDDKSQSFEDQTSSATESPRGQAWEGLSIWSHLW
ncbi:uncharacterized protein K460DRAFT_413009 [Cucurbitaria berberidis CBS 394.84]|uniref:Uncharacterized protein n=1 Tax=Cucurbitaria berberidis CBS 394.84 TaxID=1168544 RepID=A0A9P4GRN2_9PLEO|nr:uncharacterized protein K460DRAFT_413009 [Cucurbitaria berberidis CBS 394.84]KAF1851448.1 hypothetical protein K460DRAFT_413009 [Cucurbitaria berberidis CBS 394.84]